MVLARGFTRVLLIVLALFEVVAIARLQIWGHAVHDAMPLLVDETPASRASATFLLAILAVVRGAQAYDVDAAAAWRITAAVHVLEVAYFARVGIDGGTLASSVEARAIYGFVLFNAAYFSACWMTSGAGSAAARKGKAA